MSGFNLSVQFIIVAKGSQNLVRLNRRLSEVLCL